MNRDQRLRSGEEGIQKSARFLSAPRHGISKQAVMSPLLLISHDLCYRTISNSTKISKHALGLAVDINPLYNPYYRRYRNGRVKIQPSNAARYCDRKKQFAYKIDSNDLCYKLFIKHGFQWGGAWTSLKDYQHFEK